MMKSTVICVIKGRQWGITSTKSQQKSCEKDTLIRDRVMQQLSASEAPASSFSVSSSFDFFFSSPPFSFDQSFP